MYEKRYHDSVGVSDLYKMKDVVNITDDLSGKQIFVCPVNKFVYVHKYKQIASLVRSFIHNCNSTISYFIIT